MLDLEKLTDAMVSHTMKAIDRATAPLLDRLAAMEKRLQDLPQPQDGVDGAPGADGRDGQSVTVDDVAPLIAAEVARAVAEMPSPRDGKDGIDGKDGAKGENGADGAGVADLIIDRDGALIASMTDGRMKNLGYIIGKDGADGRHGQDGKDGRDGADGASLEDFTVDVSGARPVLRCIAAGKVKEIPIPGFVDRGVFKDGSGYIPGDGVTFGGSFWICQKDTDAKPGETEDWRLAVKKGRDGKDGLAAPASKTPKAGD